MASEETRDAAAPLQGMYETKLINFDGKLIPIILQNNNGHSPLVAICNALLLMGYSKLNVQMEIMRVISEVEVSSYVGELLLDFRDPDEISEEIALLHSLATVVDIDVKFTRIDAFESTPGSRIFELLNIPLYHGWVVNSQDDNTYNAIGDASYKTLCEQLLAWEKLKVRDIEEQKELDAAIKRSQIEHHAPIGESSTSSDPQNIDEPIGDQTGAELGSSSVSTTRQEPDASRASPGGSDREEGSDSEDDTDYIESLEEPIHAHNLNGKGTLEVSDSRGLEEDPIRLHEIASAKLIGDFLRTNESQLTTYGLSCLQNELKEREICVFYRNNEYRTMLKHRGELYLLVTDVNYRGGWEVLNAVNGEPSFVGSLFFDSAYGRSRSSSSTATDLEYDGSTQDPPI